MRLAKRIFSKEFKINICHEIESGLKSPAFVSREHRIGANLISRWLKEYRDNPATCFSGKQKYQTDIQTTKIKELEAALGRATYENQILREANMLLKKIQLERRFVK